MGESRQELVAWINELLLLDITKVEQCGTGAIYCQIYDSIFRDVPMSKVKFDVSSEYQYLNNFKVLQGIFTRHKIDRPLETARMAKCRLQDNLEFLQWTRRYWDAHYDGTPYDPVARRNGQDVAQPAGGARSSSRAATGSRASHRPPPTASATSSTSRPAVASASASRVSSTGAFARAAVGGSGSGIGGAASRNQVKQLNDKIDELTKTNNDLVEATQVVEAVRDFYFGKLRAIEVLVQTASEDLQKENEGKANEEEDELSNEVGKLTLDEKYVQLVEDITEILYSLEDGFEIPDEGAEEQQELVEEEDEF